MTGYYGETAAVTLPVEDLTTGYAVRLPATLPAIDVASGYQAGRRLLARRMRRAYSTAPRAWSTGTKVAAIVVGYLALRGLVK